MSDPENQTLLPVLPLRDIVVFPNMIVPLFVGREKSVRALEAVMQGSKEILLVAQKDALIEDPGVDDIYRFGAVSRVLQLLKLPDGPVKVLVEGHRRARISDLRDSGDFLQAEIEFPEEEPGDPKAVEALVLSLREDFSHYVKAEAKVPNEVQGTVEKIDEPGKLADTIAQHLQVKLPDKQKLLEHLSVQARIEHSIAAMQDAVDVMKMERKIRGRVKRQMEKTQREYYLNEQIKAIQRELGDNEEGGSEIDGIEERITKTKFSKEAREKVDAELKKLKSMGPMSAEATVVRNYLDWMLSIPWSDKSRVRKDIGQAEKVLNDDHYGLEKVKERILEYLAVQQRVKKLKGPILCLVGPPGVGKTSLGKSLARATGREFVRLSLGGVRDEAEIRGHRRTYIGSMPGKIVHAMKKAKKSNPLFLLDEVDKMGADFRGDPSSALLEVLDPEQNNSFNDHYLEVDYDLSNVMFICTANTLRMPQPLLDRMEIIRLPGYTEDEKVEIAKRHLLPKQIKAHGLKKNEWSLTEGAIRDLIRYYSREAGVRNLEREIANLARKSVKRIVSGEAVSVRITQRNLEEYAGIRRFRFGAVEDEDLVGVTTGLAWTEVGGELLSIEAVTLPGKGQMTITGKLGDVMQESIQAARSFVRARCTDFGVIPPIFNKRDIHIHVPEGATPKDGPSAGIAMVTSIVSVLTEIPVRRDIAMTGEVTLRGRVLPIGGLKEKLLAAHRAGVKKVLIPYDNEKDLKEIPDNVKRDITIVPVATVDEVLPQALTREMTAVEWDAAAYDAELLAAEKRGQGADGQLTH